jgi:hypothetical protein
MLEIIVDTEYLEALEETGEAILTDGKGNGIVVVIKRTL